MISYMITYRYKAQDEQDMPKQAIICKSTIEVTKALELLRTSDRVDQTRTIRIEEITQNGVFATIKDITRGF